MKILIHKITPFIQKKVWGYEKTIINTEKYCQKILHFYKGGSCSLHYHGIKEETWYVQSGEFILTYKNLETGDTYSDILFPGVAVRIPPCNPHQVTAITEGEILESSTQDLPSDTYRISPASITNK